MKKILFLTIVLLSVAGCKTLIDSNKITSITSRGVGIRITATTAQTQTPEIDFGFFSTSVQLIPTATNGPVSAPRFMDTFTVKATTNPFDTSIGENVGSGDVMVGWGTNTTSKAIVPGCDVWTNMPGIKAIPSAN